MKISVVGAGAIGATLSSYWARAGHEVTMANSRHPDTLREVSRDTGAGAARLETVALEADVVALSVPVAAVPAVAERIRDSLPAATIVVDTGNYVPIFRDEPIPDLDQGRTESIWTSEQIGRPVVKAFNSINAASLQNLSLPAGAPGRIALPISGDDGASVRCVARLVDEAGFDPVQAGDLESSWRQQPGTPAYTTNLDRERLQEALDLAERGHTVAWRAMMAERARPTP